MDHPWNREEFSTKIPGWGSDLHSRQRPITPKIKLSPRIELPNYGIESERQIPHIRIFKSPEHRELTPVFGTACPPKGLSGIIRKWAYQYSEGRQLHWMLLLFADRIDVIEGRVANIVKGKFPHPLTEAGLIAEWKKDGIRARLGQNRADVQRIRNQLLLGCAGAATLIWLLRRRNQVGIGQFA